MKDFLEDSHRRKHHQHGWHPIQRARRAEGMLGRRHHGHDLEGSGSARGDPIYMAEWEILAILVSHKIGINHAKATQTQLVVQTDSTAAMGAASKLASPRPRVNAVAAEITPMLEATRADLLVPRHFRGAINVEADALSRLNEGKEVPRRLTCSSRSTASRQ